MGTNQSICKVVGRGFPELLRQIRSYLPEQLRQIHTYLPEVLRQVTSSLKDKEHEKTQNFS